MKLPVGEVIHKLRKEKGITQEELAKVVGVSVPAVSKWESGGAYPDITLLPSIARYFETTIDSLMKYEITISQGEVMEINKECAKVFENDTLENAINTCEYYLRKYPNNYLLKFRIGSLYMMYMSKGETEEGIKILLHKAIRLLEQSVLSSDNEISQGSKYVLSGLYSMDGNDEKAEEILSQFPKEYLSKNEMLVPLYIKQERYDEAKKIIQNDILTKIGKISSLLTGYSSIVKKQDDIDYAIELLMIQRNLIKLFGLEGTHLQMSSLILAQIYAEKKDIDKSLKFLEEYVKQIKNIKNSQEELVNNKMFDLISLSVNRIQSEGFILETLIKGIEQSPEYDFLKEEERYKEIIKSMKSY